MTMNTNYFVLQNHNINERGNLFSPSDNCNLSRRENNFKLKELSVINGCHILFMIDYKKLKIRQSGLWISNNYKKAQDAIN